MEKKNIVGTIVGVGLSLLAVYGIAYFASKGWQKGQEKK
jgi:hypothetical protein